MPTLFFSHGKHSHPASTKITYLAQIAQALGCTTHSIDYTSTLNPETRLALLRTNIQAQQAADIVLVGSSMGGYVSTALASEMPVKGLFLMAPAFYLQGYAQQTFAPQSPAIEIVHGWQDAVVPYEHSVQFGKKHAARLHLVEDNHRLSASETFLKTTFSSFLHRVFLL